MLVAVIGYLAGFREKRRGKWKKKLWERPWGGGGGGVQYNFNNAKQELNEPFCGTLRRPPPSAATLHLSPPHGLRAWIIKSVVFPYCIAAMCLFARNELHVLEQESLKRPTSNSKARGAAAEGTAPNHRITRLNNQVQGI